MNNEHLYNLLTVGLPLLLILAGQLFNWSAVKDLKADMIARFNAVDARFNALDARIDRIHADFGQFHHIQGMHEARLNNLDGKND